MLSGCAMTQTQKPYTYWGCAIGALAGGGAGALAASNTNARKYQIGVPVGVAAGGILGCSVGYAMAPAEAPPRPPPPRKIVPMGMHFAFDKSVIRDVDKPVLDEAVETLKANPNAKIYVNGYCEAIARMRYNQKLSERRADAVAAYLEDNGIPSSQLIPRTFGKTHFVTPNNTADGPEPARRTGSRGPAVAAH